jgi:hypothetical protein
MRRSVPPRLEPLEDRLAPATWGNPWPDARHLTVSFPPDGTSGGSYTTNLFQRLNAQVSSNSAVWQREILRAFQTWAVNANINIGVVPDGGQPLGSPGIIQGDGRFGDLRMAGYALSDSAAALEQPFDVAAGTWSGDESVNTAFDYTPGRAGSYDLFSVALHEAGHALGLDHSPNPDSPMYESYTQVRTGLTAEDIGRIQALYGPRQPDGYEGAQGNGTFDRATLLPIVDGVNVLPGEADITTLGDVDFYKVTVGATIGPATVMVNTTGLSLLTARLTVYDANQRLVDSVTATDPLAGDLAIHLPGSLLGRTYYIKVESGASNVFGIGSYTIQVRPDWSLSLGNLLNAVRGALVAVDNHTNDTLASATGLTQLITQTDSRFDYVYRASISDASDVDYYLLRSPTPPAGQANVMTVMAWGMQAGGLDPVTRVEDATGHVVPARVLVHDGGLYVLQIPSAAANAVYYVRVAAYNPAGAHATGTYFLGVDFSTTATNLTTLVTNQTNPTPTMGFNANVDLLFHFVLSANAAGAPAGTGVEMTVYDAAGNLVTTLLSRAGESQSVNLFLAQGQYTFRFRTVNASGQTIAPLLFTLDGELLSDPIKPYQYDSTAANSGSGGSSSGGSSSGRPSQTTYSTTYW